MSTAIGVRFLAGRYHALPWDRHVNEADVEWPPSPLRLLRALIAVWHRKADKERFPEERLRSLIHLLAAELPVYRLPRAAHSHTRHYMPVQEGKKTKKTLIFDAFLRLSPDDELIVIWPRTDLDDEQRDLLAHLAERLGYLGRAESWAECRVLDSWVDLPDCGPASAAENWSTLPADHFEPRDLPVTLPPDEYDVWRSEQIGTLGLAKPTRNRGKKLRATLPDHLIDALRLDTGDVRDAGWSRAPATDRVTYLRPRHAVQPIQLEASRPGRRAVDPTTVRLAILRMKLEGGRLGPPLPRFEDAIKIGELIRVAAMSAFRQQPDSVPSVLCGHGMPAGSSHEHAFYLPEDVSGDGHIDHVTVHAPAGLDDASLRALGNIEKVWQRDGSEWTVLLESFGGVESFRSFGPRALPHQYLATGMVWESVTPYLHPWYRKKSFNLEDQLRRELRFRDLPAATLERLPTVKVGGTDRRSVHFHRFRARRRRRGRPQPDTQGSFWRLTFEEAIMGPLALGFACHYGLGMFRCIGK